MVVKKGERARHLKAECLGRANLTNIPALSYQNSRHKDQEQYSCSDPSISSKRGDLIKVCLVRLSQGLKIRWATLASGPIPCSSNKGEAKTDPSEAGGVSTECGRESLLRRL